MELADAKLTLGIARALKEAELLMRDSVSVEDRRLLEVIARAHGHGPRRVVALLDIAWAEIGSQDDARSALQRLLLLGLIEFGPGRQTKELFGRMTDKGAELISSGRGGVGGQ